MKRIAYIFAALFMPMLSSAQALPFTAAGYDPVSMGKGGLWAAETGSVAYSALYNPSSVVFYDGKADVAAGYALSQPSAVKTSVVDLAGAVRVSDRLGFSAAFTRGSLPKYDVIDSFGTAKGTFTPSQFQVKAGFAYRLMPYLSLGASVGYAGEKLAEEASYGAFTADIFATAVFSDFRAALGVSDIGSKVKDAAGNAFSLPSALTAAGGYAKVFGESHKVDAGVQMQYFFADGLAAGAGASYTYAGLVSLRAGYNYGGNTPVPSFASVGAGLCFYGVGLDFAYLLADKSSPMNGTICCSLRYSF